MVLARSSGRMASPSGTLLLPFPAPRYRSRHTGQAHLGLRPCGKKSKRCLPKEPWKSPPFWVLAFPVASSWWRRRPVIGQSHLNEFVHLTPLMMVTVASVLLSVRGGDFLASLDLKDTYLQIPIPHSLRKLWGSRQRGRLPVRRPVFRTLDRSPGQHYGLRQRRLTRTGSDFSGIWTTGWFLPPRSGQPDRWSSPFSRFVAPAGL